MGFSPSRTTTSPTVYFQESRVAVQHPLNPIMYYYNDVPRHISSNSIDLNFLILATTLQRRFQIDVASLRCCQPAGVIFFPTLVPVSGNFQLSRLAGLGYGLGFWVVITIIVSLTLTLITTLTVILP